MFLVVVMVLSGLAWADAVPPAPRSQGGRRFLLPARVAHPFNPADIVFRQGGGVVTIPDAATVPGKAPSTLRMVGVVQRIAVGVPLTPWFGLRGAISGQVTTGLDQDSAVYAGARAGFDWELDSTIVVAARDRVRWSVNPGVFGSNGTQVEPATVVASALRYSQAAVLGAQRPPSASDLTGDLLQPTRTVGGGVAGTVAWRAGARTGLIGSVRLRGGYAEAQGVAGLPLSYSVGAAADWRFAEAHPFVGQIEYRFRNVHDASVDSEAPLEDRLESRHLGGLGVFWRTPREAEVGLSGWSLLRNAARDERLAVVEASGRIFF